MGTRNLLKQIPRLKSRGIDILRDPGTNKGTSYAIKERQILGIHGLLPPAILTQEQQTQRVISSLYQLDDDLGRYSNLMSLQDRNEKLFYKTVSSHLNYCLPLIYTPTVAQACKNFGLVFRRPRGLYITIHDRKKVLQLLGNWPEKRVKAIVMTDGERILGLGDLGSSAMAVAVGKVTLYTALAGILPRHCLPICIDVGTDNQALLEDRFYHGLRQKRVKGEEYEEFMDEVMNAFRTRYGPHVCIQFEDFAKENAFKFLEKYSEDYVCFNNDINASGSVALAGLLNACRATGTTIKDHKYLFYGSGQSAIGTANLLVKVMMDDLGLSEQEALKRIYMLDRNGLITEGRSAPISDLHRRFVRSDVTPLLKLEEVIRAVRPTVLIGTSGQGKAFTRGILRDFSSMNKVPIVFALSNPTECSECDAELAFRSTDCKCIFVSGSPFSSVKVPDGKEYFPSQGNNMYIFPGVALALTSIGIQPANDDLFIEAAKCLSNLTSDAELARGSMYPAIERLPDVSLEIALHLTNYAYDNNIASYHPEPTDKVRFLRTKAYNTDYNDFVPEPYSWPSEH